MSHIQVARWLLFSAAIQYWVVVRADPCTGQETRVSPEKKTIGLNFYMAEFFQIHFLSFLCVLLSEEMNRHMWRQMSSLESLSH